jgi:hypothetical protein
MFMGIGIALTGISRISTTEGATLEGLLTEINWVYGELASKIVSNNKSKIITEY